MNDGPLPLSNSQQLNSVKSFLHHVRAMMASTLPVSGTYYDDRRSFTENRTSPPGAQKGDPGAQKGDPMAHISAPPFIIIIGRAHICDHRASKCAPLKSENFTNYFAFNKNICHCDEQSINRPYQCECYRYLNLSINHT